MKISFRARFRDSKNFKDIYDEVRLNDAFLVFLPKKLEIIEAKNAPYGRYYDITLETDKLLTLEDLKETLSKLRISASNFCRIKREFTDKEREEIKTMVCFKEIFQPVKGKKKK